MMDALLCNECKRVEQKPWEDECNGSQYNSCLHCGPCHSNVSWLRTDGEKKAALIAASKEFVASAMRVQELVSIAFPEGWGMLKHDDGTLTEMEIALDFDGIEVELDLLIERLSRLTRKIG